MAREIICFLFVHGLMFEVLSTYAQPTMQQYLHLTGGPPTAQTVTVPATYNPAAINQATGTNFAATNQPRPSTGPPGSFSALALPDLVSNFQRLPEPKFTEVKTASPSSIDSNLLNNLAVALQLLILSNILNGPKADGTVKPMKDIRPYSEPTKNPYYSQYQTVMPNSQFVGTSSFGEPNFAQTYKPTRNSMSLMSPYEALGPSSLYSDPILSQYGSSNPRQDFQSPYTMMEKNSLSMNDLF